jgi:hypothetical protein
MEKPEEFLKRFFDAMHEWEDLVAQRLRGARVSPHEDDPELAEKAYAESLQDLREIWKRFGIRGEPKRGVQFSTPPEYDRNAEIIQQVVPCRNGVRIYTQQANTGYDNRLIYTLDKTRDGWRLRDNRVYIDDDGLVTSDAARSSRTVCPAQNNCHHRRSWLVVGDGGRRGQSRRACGLCGCVRRSVAVSAGRGGRAHRERRHRL